MNMPTMEETHPNYQATGIHCWGSTKSPECKHLLQEEQNEESGNDIASFQKDEEGMAEMCCLAEWYLSLLKEYMSGEMKSEIMGILFLPQNYMHRLAGCLMDLWVTSSIMYLLIFMFYKNEIPKNSSSNYWVLCGLFAPGVILFLLQVYRRPIVFCFPDEWVATHPTKQECLAKQGYQSATMWLLVFGITAYTLSLTAWFALQVTPFIDL